MMEKSPGSDIASFLAFMSREGLKGKSPAVRPRDSASLILLDRSSRSVKVLMGRRNEKQRFMPGKFVFPGGCIEPADRRMPVAGTLSARAEDALAKQVVRPSPQRARALALAAIRETFEETGLMVGTRDYGAPEAPAESIWQDFAESGVFPDIEQLSFVARAITPPGLPKRFDTRFFVADRNAIAHTVDGFIGPDKELTELTWIKLSDVESLDLAVITSRILTDLRERLAAGMSELLPVPHYYVRHGRAVREML